MANGTINLVNNSTALTGVGSEFLTEVTPGDFVYVEVGTVPYTLPVDKVNSDTSITLLRRFSGPTINGIAWTLIPRRAQYSVAAALADQVAEAIRLSLNNENNWQQLLTVEGDVTITRPDGSTYTGPSWIYLSNSLENKANTSQLGTAAFKNAQESTIDTTSGRILTVGAFNLGVAFPSGASIRLQDGNTPTGFYGSGGDGYSEIGVSADLTTFTINRGNRPTRIHQAYSLKRTWFSYYSGSAWTYHEAYTTGNTTKASDGTLKAASPIVKLFANGSFETNEESEGATVTRLDVGQYLIEGCEALNSDAAWGGWDGGFDIPTDRNKQPLIWLDYDVNPDGSVLVKTYHRTHPDSPEFARNRIGYKNDAGEFIETVANGDPVDIPSDQFVSVRVEMPQDSIWNQRQKEIAEMMDAETFNQESTTGDEVEKG